MNTPIKPIVICPHCESEFVVQVHRLRIEKWVTEKCKYWCTDCEKHFFILKPELRSSNHTTRDKGESYFHFYRS